MLQGWVVVLASFAYLCLLFAIAFYGDKRADRGRSIIANPYIWEEERAKRVREKVEKERSSRSGTRAGFGAASS